MKLNTYIVFQYIIILIRIILCPIVRVLGVFLPAISKRLDFEAKNRKMPSFNDEGHLAHSCFHVSSEGELEQCLYIILDLLADNKRVELVYTSPSVERKCLELDDRFENLKTFRLGVLSYPLMRFNSYVTAKRFFMCRYDFFSELMLYGARKDVKFVLLSASLKNKEKKLGHFMSSKFELYSEIFAASESDVQLFKKLNNRLNVREYEFRVLQISKRLKLSIKTLSARSEVAGLVECLENRDPNSSLILGSAWPDEMKIFENEELVRKIKSGELLVVVAPHGLSTSFIDDVKNSITDELSVQVLEVGESPLPGNVVINPFPGVLVEMYKYFGHSFVGGGHGRSVHSLLEPFLAGSMVYCGPKTFRSTEYDFILSRSEMNLVVIEELSTLANFLKSLEREKELIKREEIVDNYFIEYKQILDSFKC